MDKIRILLADDDGIIRTGMEMILETQEDFEVANTILAHQDVKILLLTTFDEPELITAAMQAAVSRKLGKHSLFRMALCEIISLLF